MTKRFCVGAWRAFAGLVRREDGQDLMEYGLLASLIATFLIGTLNVVGDRLDGLWQAIAVGIQY